MSATSYVRRHRVRSDSWDSKGNQAGLLTPKLTLLNGSSYTTIHLGNISRFSHHHFQGDLSCSNLLVQWKKCSNLCVICLCQKTQNFARCFCRMHGLVRHGTVTALDKVKPCWRRVPLRDLTIKLKISLKLHVRSVLISRGTLHDLRFLPDSIYWRG